MIEKIGKFFFWLRIWCWVAADFAFGDFLSKNLDESVIIIAVCYPQFYQQLGSTR